MKVTVAQTELTAKQKSNKNQLIQKAELAIMSQNIESLLQLRQDYNLNEEMQLITFLLCYRHHKIQLATILASNWPLKNKNHQLNFQEIDEDSQALTFSSQQEDEDVDDDQLEFEREVALITSQKTANSKKQIQSRMATILSGFQNLSLSNQVIQQQKNLPFIEQQNENSLEFPSNKKLNYQDIPSDRQKSEQSPYVEQVKNSKIKKFQQAPKGFRSSSLRKSFAQSKKQLAKYNQIFQIVANESINMILSNNMSSQNSLLASQLVIQAINKNSDIPYLFISQKTFLNFFQIKDESATLYSSKKSGLTNQSNFSNESSKQIQSKFIKFVTQLIQSRKVKLTSKQKKSQLTLFSLANIMIQRLINPKIWKEINQNLTSAPQPRCFNKIAFKPKGSSQTKEFFLKCMINSPKYDFKINDFLGSINSHCYEAAYLIVLKFESKFKMIKDSISRGKIGWALNHSIQEQDFLELKLWISIKLIHCFSYKVVNDMMLEQINFGACKNPIKAILLYIKFLQGIGAKFSIQNRRINQKIKTSKEICGNFIQNCDSEIKLRSMIFQEDFDGKSVMFLMYKHSQLLSKVEQIITQMWTGPYESKQANQECKLTQYYLFGKHQYTQDELTPKSLFQNASYTQSIPVCNYYNIRESIRMKHLFSFFIVFIIALSGQLIVLQLNQNQKLFWNGVTAAQENGTDLLGLADYARQTIYKLRIFTFLVLPYTFCFSFVQITLDLFFSSKIKKSYNFFICQNLSLFIILFCTIMCYALINKEAFWFTQETDQDYINLVYNLENVIPQLKLKYVQAILWATFWTRITLSFRLTKTLGPLLKIILSMTKEILIFMALETIILLSFACIGITVFYIPQFQSLWQALILLFSSALGGFDFQVFQPEERMGSIFLIIFLLINLVLMLNLLIAILSSIFAVMESYGVGLYLQGILDIYQDWQYREEFNALTFRNAPFNAFNLVLLCTSRRKLRKMSQRCEICQYIPIMLISLGFALGVNIIMAPLVWIKLIVKSLEQKKKKCRNCMFIFLLYLPFSIIIIIKDMVIYAKKLFEKPVKRISSFDQQNSKNQKVKMQILLDFLSFLQQQYGMTKKQKSVNSAQIILKYRQVIGFTCDVPDFIKIIEQVEKKSKKTRRFSLSRQKTYQQNKFDTNEHKYVSTQSYNSIKQFVYQNSFMNEKSKKQKIYPRDLINSIKECLISERLQIVRSQFKLVDQIQEEDAPQAIINTVAQRVKQFKTQSNGHLLNSVLNSETAQSRLSTPLHLSLTSISPLKKPIFQSKTSPIVKRGTTAILNPSFNFISKSVDAKMEAPSNVHILQLGKMMRAEEQYYLENIDVGVMLKDYIDEQKGQNKDDYEESPHETLRKRNELLERFRSQRRKTVRKIDRVES